MSKAMVERKSGKEAKKTKEQIGEARQNSIAHLLASQISRENAKNLAKQLLRGAED